MLRHQSTVLVDLIISKQIIWSCHTYEIGFVKLMKYYFSYSKQLFAIILLVSHF